MSKPENKQLEGMLEDKDKSVGEATGILSRLFRQILADQNVTAMLWNKMMNAYLDDPRNRVPRDSRGRSSHRGNLNKELLKPNMTWNNFIKGIYFLNPVWAEFKITLKWRTGRYTEHRIAIGEEDKVGEQNQTNDE